MRDVIAALYPDPHGLLGLPPAITVGIYLASFITALLVTWFVRRQLRLKPSRTTSALAYGRLTGTMVLCVWFWLLFFAWPWLNWQNPWLFGYPIPSGIGLSVVSLCTGLFGLVWLYAFAAVENGSSQLWFALLKMHEWLCLKMLGATHQHIYQHHMRWRFVLWGQTMAERWRGGRIQQWLQRQRWLWVMLAGSASLSLLLWTAQWLNPEQPLQTTLQQVLFPTDKENGRGSAGAWSLFSAFLAAPMAFVLWWFRDTNQLWLIENSRKDTNLKDFQKLSEWASGITLVEDEVSTKTGSGQDTPEVSTKTTAIPPSAFAHRLTRRAGSEALQISAVHQLQGYLMGEYGQQFQKPAFALLTALWQSISEPARHAWPAEMAAHAIAHWHRTHALHFRESPLAQAIASTLLARNGRAMREHAALLPNLKFTGLPTRLPGLRPLRLNDMDLEGIELQGADLSGIQLQRARLVNAKLQGAILRGAQLQAANLMKAQLHHVSAEGICLQGASMRFAKLDGAEFMGAQLQDAVLFRAQLLNAQLSFADLQRASFRQTNFNGVELTGTQLQGTQIINASFDEEVRFSGSETDLDTVVGVSHNRGRPNSEQWLPLPTHALRLKLRDVNQLELPDPAYQEFKPLWDALTEQEREKIYNNAYDFSANPRHFIAAFPHLVKPA